MVCFEKLHMDLLKARGNIIKKKEINVVGSTTKKVQNVFNQGYFLLFNLRNPIIILKM